MRGDSEARKKKVKETKTEKKQQEAIQLEIKDNEDNDFQEIKIPLKKEKEPTKKSKKTSQKKEKKETKPRRKDAQPTSENKEKEKKNNNNEENNNNKDMLMEVEESSRQKEEQEREEENEEKKAYDSLPLASTKALSVTPLKSSLVTKSLSVTTPLKSPIRVSFKRAEIGMTLFLSFLFHMLC